MYHVSSMSQTQRHQMPIESRFLENMANALNAEIVGKLKKLRKSQVANADRNIQLQIIIDLMFIWKPGFRGPS